MKNSKISGRIERWNAQVGQFEIKYEILSSPKSQVIADFLAEFPLEEDEDHSRWEILVDGSSNGEGNGSRIVFISPEGARITYSFRLEFAPTNNETEYEEVVHALQLAIEMKLEDVRINSDPQLVIHQIEGTYNTDEPSLQKYKKLVAELSTQIPKISWRHISRKENRLAYAFSFIPSMMVDPTTRYIKIQTLFSPSIKKEEKEDVDVMIVENEEEEKVNKDAYWRTKLHLYLEKGEVPRNRLESHKLKSRATNYELKDGVLYRRSFYGPSIRCLTRKEGMEILKALHYEDAGNHSGGPFIPGTGQKRYLIVGTDYFTKWAEVKAVQHIRDKYIFTFIFENIIYRFGIPAQLVSDNGKQFEGENIKMLLNAFKIQSGKSSHLYPQSNGQEEATNKKIADTVKKKLEGHNIGWCEQVHNAVWE
ncbi:uncharacterized protein LOC113329709 [Papaver somniferum]|uniref:uncharacterized protein LOC113329709 n=1 Tax=Papaver somniferum TaxID=3469 RepID=UPI000E6FF36A|nr:uncharacterized protein LOC113329709 [Papaver somniferum]